MKNGALVLRERLQAQRTLPLPTFKSVISETSLLSKFTKGELIVLGRMFCQVPYIAVDRIDVSATYTEL
jgi:hypothetical protein